ncbi:MAG: hypothetical protein LQ341_004132 [Variospora aurantia]|nr:MAG: hypothetical protein LQ341_004132 [Variospora aurantia]
MPAMISPTQKVHRHEMTDMKPEMIGASCGPHTHQHKFQGRHIEATYCHEEGHCAPTDHGIIEDISTHAAYNRDWAGGCDAAQQPEDQKEWPVGCKSTCHGEYSEEDEGHHHDDSTAVAFAQRRENYGPEDIANKKEGYREHELCLTRDMKILGDVVNGSAR